MSKETYAAMHDAIAAHLADVHSQTDDGDLPSVAGDWLLIARAADATGASGYMVEFSAGSLGPTLSGLARLGVMQTDLELEQLVYREDDQ